MGNYYLPFPNKPWFLRVCSTSLLKTQWEKEKLLVTSNFSFSHSVFYPYGELSTIFIKLEIVVFQFGRVKNLSFGKGLYQGTKFCACLYLTHSHTLLSFYILLENAFEKNMGKGEKADIGSFFSSFHMFTTPSQNTFQFSSHICFVGYKCLKFRLL